MASLAFPFTLSPKIELRNGNSMASIKTQVISQMKKDNNGGRRIWRRRKMTKKDKVLEYSLERVPFLEEQVRMIQEGGKIMALDVETLLLREDNKFDFVNEIAAEATEYVKKNRDEYGGTKKAIFHAISNRMNEFGFYRPEAYEENDPFKPGPFFLREELYDQP